MNSKIFLCIIGELRLKILFIYCENTKNDIYKFKNGKPLYSNDQIPFGISYLSSALKDAGHEVFLTVLEGHEVLNNVESEIQSVKPEAVCFSVVFREFDQYMYIADYIKKRHTEIYIIAGGPHISLFPNEAIKTSLDIISLSEGEISLVELMNHLQSGEDYTKIPGIWAKIDGTIYRNETRPFNCDLDKLSYPDRDMWLPFIENTSTPISILLGRGCYFGCTYCSNHALKNISKGKYVRYRSVENILGEISYLVEHFPKNDTIYFEIEAINCDHEFMKEFCTKLVEFNKRQSRTIYYGTNVRITPNMDWPYIFKMFRKANIGYVNIGLESGSERVRREIMNRIYSNDDVLQAMMAAKKNRICTMLYVLVGLPTETMEEFEMSVEMIRRCKPTTIHMGIFYPYPGTDLYVLCEKKGLLSTLKADIGRNIASLDMPQFSRRNIQNVYDMFYPRIYAHSRFEMYYIYILIKLGRITGIRSINEKAVRTIGKREVADSYVK